MRCRGCTWAAKYDDVNGLQSGDVSVREMDEGQDWEGS